MSTVDDGPLPTRLLLPEALGIVLSVIGLMVKRVLLRWRGSIEGCGDEMREGGILCGDENQGVVLRRGLVGVDGWKELRAMRRELKVKVEEFREKVFEKVRRFGGLFSGSGCEGSGGWMGCVMDVGLGLIVVEIVGKIVRKRNWWKMGSERCLSARRDMEIREPVNMCFKGEYGEDDRLPATGEKGDVRIYEIEERDAEDSKGKNDVGGNNLMDLKQGEREKEISLGKERVAEDRGVQYAKSNGRRTRSKRKVEKEAKKVQSSAKKERNRKSNSSKPLREKVDGKTVDGMLSRTSSKGGIKRVPSKRNVKDLKDSTKYKSRDKQSKSSARKEENERLVKIAERKKKEKVAVASATCQKTPSKDANAIPPGKSCEGRVSKKDNRKSTNDNGPSKHSAGAESRHRSKTTKSNESKTSRKVVKAKTGSKRTKRRDYKKTVTPATIALPLKCNKLASTGHTSSRRKSADLTSPSSKEGTKSVHPASMQEGALRKIQEAIVGGKSATPPSGKKKLKRRNSEKRIRRHSELCRSKSHSEKCARRHSERLNKTKECP